MATKKSPIQAWLDSKERNYQDGVKLYAEHPTAIRGLVNTLQRKENDYTREKLVYVLEKAAEADAEGATKALKKKGKQPSAKAKPKTPKKVKPVEKKLPADPPKKEAPANLKPEKEVKETQEKKLPADLPKEETPS